MIRNIVIFNDYGFVFGGASSVAIQSAIDLSKSFNVIFIYCFGPLCNDLINKNIKTFKINSSKNLIWNSSVNSGLNKLTNNLSAENTIMHIHNFTKGFTISLLYWISKSKFIAFVTIHDFFLFCPNGAYFNFNQNKICKLIPGSYKCLISNCDKYNFLLKLFKHIRFLLIRFMVFRSDNFNFIAVSDYSKEILNNTFNFKKIHLLKNNFTSLKSNYSFNFEGKQPIFSFVGRLDNSKGVILLAEAARKANVPIHFFGDGPLLGFLKNNYSENYYYGFVNQKFMKSIYKKSNCVILPSLYHEIDGLVVRESLSVHTPVIVSSTCSAKEFIEDSVNGYIFESGSKSSLVDKLNLMMNNKNYERIGKVLIKNPTNNYSVTKLKNYIELYK